MTLDRCSHPDHYLARVRTESGTIHVTMWCDACELPVAKHVGHPGVWVSQAWLDKHGYIRDDLPPVRDERKLRRCYRCTLYRPCELHHCAPKEYFGDEAERWPIVWACTECHDRYHRRFGRPIRGPEAA